MEPKQKQHPVVDVTGDRSNVRCCKEQYCIGTWNVRSMLCVSIYLNGELPPAPPFFLSWWRSKFWERVCSKERTCGSGQAAWGEGRPPATAATSLGFEYSMLTAVAKVCGPAMVAMCTPPPCHYLLGTVVPLWGTWRLPWYYLAKHLHQL